MSKPTGPNTRNKKGEAYRCSKCGKPRMRGTEFCSDCTKEIKKENAGN